MQIFKGKELLVDPTDQIKSSSSLIYAAFSLRAVKIIFFGLFDTQVKKSFHVLSKFSYAKD